MKRITFFPFYPHYAKYAGLSTALAGLILTYLLSPEYQVLFYLGLFLIIFSEEKNESVHIHHVRTEVFKSVFGLSLALGIALKTAELVSSSYVVVITPFLYLGLPLLLYLLLFYFILAFKVRVSPADTVIEDKPRSGKLNRIWFTIILVVIVITILLTTGMI